MKVFFLQILFACLLAVPVRAPQQSAPDTSRAAQEDDVREAVFRYQFSNLDIRVSYYFLEVAGKNPSDALLDRFRANVPAVRSASESKVQKKPIRTIVDRKSGKEGVIFRQGTVEWKSDTQADVSGGHECGDTCDTTNGTYHVVKKNNQWLVDSFDSAKPAG